MISLLGTLLGFSTSIIPEVLGYFKQRQANEQELRMLEAKAKYADKLSELKIKELDAQAYIDATSGLEAHRDSMLAIIDNMIAEEQTKEQNNVAYLTKIKEQWEREEEDLLMKRRHNYQETARALADIEILKDKVRANGSY